MAILTNKTNMRGSVFLIVARETLPFTKRIVKEIESKNLPVSFLSSFDRPDIVLRTNSYWPVLIYRTGSNIYFTPITSLSTLDKAISDPENNMLKMVEETSFFRVKNLEDVGYDELIKNLLFLYDPLRGGLFERGVKRIYYPAFFAALATWLIEKEIRVRKIIEDTLETAFTSPLFNRSYNLMESGSISYDWLTPVGEILTEDNIELSILLLNASKSIPNRKYEKIAVDIYKGIETIFFEREKVLLGGTIQDGKLIKSEKSYPRVNFKYVSLLSIIYRINNDQKVLEKAHIIFQEHSKNTNRTELAFLTDYTSCIEAAINLFIATADKYYLTISEKFLEEVDELFYDSEKQIYRDTLDRSLPTFTPIVEICELTKSLLTLERLLGKTKYRERAVRILETSIRQAIERGTDGIPMIIPLVMLNPGPIVIKLTGKDPKLTKTTKAFITPLTVIEYHNLESTTSSVEICFGDKCYEPAHNQEILRDQLVSILISRF